MSPRIPTTPDRQLLQAWRDGDLDAGAELFERHWQSISRFFTNKLGPDCEDLIQSTFLACVENVDKYRGDSSFRSYLFGIARNKLLRHLRTKARDAKYFDPASVSVADSVQSYTSVIEADRVRTRLLIAMRELPVDTQVMLELHYWEKLPIREIAQIVEMPVNTVKARMRRGRMQLSERLRDTQQPLMS